MWEEDLAREMQKSEQRRSNPLVDVHKTVAARQVKIAELWRLIDLVIERVNQRVADGSRYFHTEESTNPETKAIYYGGRSLVFEVEPLAYDAWRNEPVFYSGGLAKVYVHPPARDLHSLFCAVSEEGARWLVMPSQLPLTDEVIGMMLRKLVI